MVTENQIQEIYELEKGRILSLSDESDFGKNIWNIYQFVSWAKWYPDLYVELFKSKDSNMQLHFDQRVFMRADVRFQSMYGTFSRGYAKCIAGDSIIFTDNGIKEIGEYFDYQSNGIETHYETKVNVVNRYGRLEKTKLGLYNGKQECLTIKTDDGFSITGTKVHKVLTMDRSGDIKFTKTSDITTGDYVLINRKNDIWGNNKIHQVQKSLNTYISSCSKQSKSHLNVRPLPLELNYELGKLFGYLIGDGCLTTDGAIIFSNCGDSILDEYKRLCIKYFNTQNIRKVSKYDYRLNDKYLRKYFEFLGFGYDKADKKIIPPHILSSSKEVLSGVLQGLFDTDGTVDDKLISYCTVSKKLATQIQMILLNLGIISRIKKYKTNGGLRYCYKIFISGNDTDLFNEFVGFGLKYKQERLNLLCQKNHNTNKNVIPHQKSKLQAVVSNAGLPKSEFEFLYHALKGNNELSYSKLDKLLNVLPLDCAGRSHFDFLREMNYYFSKVDNIEECVIDVYDFHLPDTHSFFSNGFISHNTYCEVLDDFIVATLHPNITLSVTAQTRENSAALLEDKTNEILTHFPLLENEIEKKSFSKNDARIVFKNGAVITNLANAQSSKGRRRHRIKIEESALLNNALYEDALEPIVEVPRTTIGTLAVVDPEEMNFQIHYFTTSGFRGSDEYNRSVRMVNGMRGLSGDVVLGSDWMLPCYYGRGSTKSQILKKKKRSNPIFFAQNYEQKWVGCSDGALVDINKLMATRILEFPVSEIENDEDEFYIGVDVARSENTNNNQSAIVVIKVIRNPNTKRIIDLELVNIFGVSNKMNFTDQACYVKKLKKLYRAKMVIADGNGLGAGLVDELLKDSYDKITGEYLGCFDTINTDNQPQSDKAEQCLFDMKAQSFQTKALSHFINAVDSGMLKMLIHKQEQDFNDKEREFFDKNVLPFVNTELLFFEIANLKLKSQGKNLSVEKVVRKIDKDKFSAALYCIFYIMEFCNKDDMDEYKDYSSAPICASAVNF